MPKIQSFFLILMLTCSTAAWAVENSTKLDMPDGQLQTHLVKIFVTTKVTAEMAPKLRLHMSHALTEASPQESKWREPKLIDVGHPWEIELDGVATYPSGTLLLFDLRKFPIPKYKASVRVLPELVWTESKDKKLNAIANREIYLANPIRLYIWSIGIISLIGLFIFLLARISNSNPISLFCESNGKLSLSKVQMTLWTLAIGEVVFAFGLIKMEVPNIPDTLLMLMGASLITTGISQFKAKTASSKANSAKVDPRIYHLVSSPPSAPGGSTLSLARAQMLFWTILTIILFVSKSVLDGVMWDVPVELVGLMGMSQLTYLAPKLKIP